MDKGKAGTEGEYTGKIAMDKKEEKEMSVYRQTSVSDEGDEDEKQKPQDESLRLLINLNLLHC